MVAFTIETEMLAIILFSVYLAPLKAVEIKQPLSQLVNGPMTYLPPATHLPAALAPFIPPAYITKMDQTDFQVPLVSENCRNSEMLQNVLSVLNRLLNQESISQFKEPNEMQIQILAMLKKYLEIKESRNVQNDNKHKIEAGIKTVPISEIPNDDSPTNHIKAEFAIKYDIPNTSCKDAINALIQTLYKAYSRLNLLCKQTGKCIFNTELTPSHFQDLPSIFSDLSVSPIPKDLYSNKMNDIPNLNDPRNQISTYQTRPEINFDLNHIPDIANLNLHLNKIPSNAKENVYQNHNNINDYHMLLEQLKKLNGAENIESKDWDDNKILTEQLYAKEINRQENFEGIPHVPPTMNYVPNKILSFDEFYKVFQNHNSKLAVADHVSASANENKHIGLNYQYNPQDLYIPNEKLYNAPENRLQTKLSHAIENVPKDSIYNKESSQIIDQLLTPKAQEMYLKPVNHQDIHIINHESNIVNPKGHPFSVNPQAPSYFPDYLQQGVYGSKLLDSQHSASVHNLVKLNSASDNNGIVELTYMLTQPEPFTNKRYYYVKYRLPYRAFVLKVFDLSKNSNLMSDPLRIHEELLSASKLAEVSSDLRTIGSDELNKLIRKEGALVDAKVLPVNSKTDEYLKTIQKLNSKLNTNEILNLVKNGTKPKKDFTDTPLNFRNPDLDDKELTSKIYLDPNLMVSSNPYFKNISRRSFLPISLSNAVAMNSMNPFSPFTALTSNNMNPQVKYNTAIKPQSFAPYSFIRPSKRPIPIFG